MGYTKREIISAAFEEIGLASYIFDLQPEQLQSALRKLELMMATWAAKGIQVGYVLSINPSGSELDSESNIVHDAIEAVVLNLSVKLAPSYGKAVPPELKVAAKQTYSVLLALTALPLEMQFPTGMIAGAGHKNGRVYLNPSIDPIQVNNSEILEF
ncbi:tail adaptor [Caudoviricetes sp.]|nr:tail adaptor [Caudoviricetes sp.]